MVNSERDHSTASMDIFSAFRMRPVLIPDEDGAPVRHVYGEDVVQAIVRLPKAGLAKAAHITMAGRDVVFG